jgi:tetratricopeptide (TPR) repeat protein
VVVINTKTGSPTWDGEFDLAQIQGNHMTEPVLDREAVALNDPIYLKKLTGSQTAEEARVIYGEFEDSYSSFPYFNLDSYRFFFDMPGARDFADEIIESNISKWEDNASLLKALAFIYTAQNRYQKALQLNKKIMVLRPNYGQSYLDLGMAYADAGEITQAITLFARYKHLIAAGLLETSEDFQEIIQNEIDNLLNSYPDSLVADPKRTLQDPYADTGTRLLVAWNDSEAEFHLQFVNPAGKVYTWEHTFESNEARILDEKLKGYSVAEYLIDNSLSGEWDVQIKYLGNKSRTPTYMRITVYEKFNTAEQQKTTKVFKLMLKDIYQHLFSLNIGSTMPWEE